METSVSGFTFFSNFDSGNLAAVEVIPEDVHPLLGLPELNDEAPPPEKGGPLVPANHSFRIWTRPDCSETEFENGNRTWFYFGFRGGDLTDEESHPLLRFTVMNLNKQSKLFSQGMSPIVMVVPLPHTVSGFGKDKAGLRQAYPQQWERIRDKPTYWTLNNDTNKSASNFVMSFRVRSDPKATTYVAFTYPYTYKELQIYLGRLDRKYGSDSTFPSSQIIDEKQMPSQIYYHRELATRSLLGFRIDLMTLTDSNGMTSEREAVLENIFPDNPHTPRARVFKGKKVVFVSARVHPGETQSSFVLNGLIKFLLRETDPRAIVLRRKYVFKLMPMLNPDGVVHGHYRTDSRGVNLNRVYGSPSLELHPTIYAARKLLLYAHHGMEVEEPVCNEEVNSSDEAEVVTTVERSKEEARTPTPDLPSIPFKVSPMAASHWLRSCLADPSSAASSSLLSSSSTTSEPVKKSTTAWYEMTETSRFSEGDESIADFSVGGLSSEKPKLLPALVPPVPAADKPLTTFSGAFASNSNLSPKRRLFPEGANKDETSNGSSTLSEVPKEEDANLDFPTQPSLKLDALDKATKQAPRTLTVTPTKMSGLFLYVDIHGHASKRGIFMYGNHFAEIDHQLGCMLLPKLMSINCAHFDFPACVFTERNMYMKDRHTGAGREGSGRVAAFKATGLLQSYTLECNFNTGRLVNGIPMASRDSGRASPPPIFDHPPKYDGEVYEDSGKALAIAILDMTESNPWTRLTCSAHKNLRGVRDWLKKYIKAQAEEAAAAASKTPEKKSSSSPSRSLRSAARRVRTFSSSSATFKLKKAGPAAKAGPCPASPESYRPVSKIARKNSAQQCQGGRRGMASRSISASTASKQKRKPLTTSFVRARSQSVVISRQPRSRPTSPTAIVPRSRSRPTSPTRASRSRPNSPPTRRPASRTETTGKIKKTPKTARKLSALRKPTNSLEANIRSEAAASAGSNITIVPSPKKKPMKRVRRRHGKNTETEKGQNNAANADVVQT